MPRIGLSASFSLLIASLALPALAADDVHFESHVRSIFKAHCFHCHGEEEEIQGNLDVRLVRTMLAGGDSGTAIVPGKPAESVLVERIQSDDMPPVSKKLSAEEKATIIKWIEQGAKTLRPEPEAPIADAWTEEERSFWSFQPVVRPNQPAVKRAELVRSPIDSFLLARLEQEGLSYSDTVDRRTLIRRLSFDLLGLPPSPEQIEAFVNDSAPDAYERLVDNMLASPAYGERWARHWLDPAGYADSDGYTEKDTIRPWAFRYRDYVIRAFNNDKPLDQFVVEQLAGDEMVPPPYKNLSPEDADRLAATGFLRMAPDGTGVGDVDQMTARNDVVIETIKIVSTSLLGVTVGCAQCHNHRYDPISQADYFRIRAIFEPAFDTKNWRAPNARLVSLWTPEEIAKAGEVSKKVQEITKKRMEELDAIVLEIFEKEVNELDPEKQKLAREARDTPADKRTAEHKQILKDHPSLNVSRGSAYLYDRKRLDTFNKNYDKLIEEAKAERPLDSYVACLTEVPGKVPPTHLHYRGDFSQPREEIKPGGLSVLGERTPQIPVDDPSVPTTGRRLSFARSLTSGEHPLTSRVLVNRIWLHHFGRGLVASAGDFGLLGERPSHPELLDWLADELVKSGWQMKHLHRLMVLSTAYQQSSARSDALQAKDPDNRLLGRMPVRRLEAEAIRDAILDVAGTRSTSMFGPPSPVNPDDVGQAVIGGAMRDGNGLFVAKADGSEMAVRRSIYVQVRRSLPLGMLEPFDIPANSPNCEQRTTSTVAPQSLLMMNSAFTIAQSEAFAQRIIRDAGDDVSAQIQQAWQLAFGHAATEAEVAEAKAFLDAQREYFEKQPAPKAPPKDQPQLTSPQQSLALLCQALISSNRFLYVD